MTETLPLKMVKRIMKEQWDGEISYDACVYVRDVLYDVLCDIIEFGVYEFEEVNNCRKQHGLPRLKRLDKSSFSGVSSLYSQYICNYGKIGQVNRDLLFCRKKEAVEVV